MIENIFMNSGKDIRVVAYKTTVIPTKTKLKSPKNIVQPPVLQWEHWAGPRCWHWAALVWTDGQVVAASGHSRPDPGPGWQRAAARCPDPATVLYPRPESGSPECDGLGPSLGARDELLMRVGSGSGSWVWSACHHSYPAPSDHPLMGSISTRDHMHKHQHKHWQRGKLLAFLQVRTLTIHYGGKTQFRNILSKCK